MTRRKYATPSMVERAAQECSARASWWANGAPRTRPGVSHLARASSRSVMDGLEDGCLWRDIWAEAEARLREGRLPDGWILADRWCRAGGWACRVCRVETIANTAWAPGKGP